MQEFIRHGVLAPSFAVSAAHDAAALEQTVDAVAATMPVYARALEHGVESEVTGRFVRPAIRRRG